MGVIGLILGIIVFVFLVYCGHHRVLMAFIGAAVMLLLAGSNVLVGIKSYFLPAMGGFVQGYGLIFILSSVFGKIMAETGISKSLAIAASNVVLKCSDKTRQRILCLSFVPLIYFILTYIGINGMVIAFTVMPIARDLFARTDTPWRLYCCAGAQVIGTTFLAGNLSVTNISAAQVCGTDIVTAPLLSFVFFISFEIASVALIIAVSIISIKKEEGFLPSGEGILKVELAKGVTNDMLPPLYLSILPILAVIISSVVFKLDVIVALLIGCVITAVIGFKNIKGKLKEILITGANSCYSPLLAVAATVGFGGVLKNLEAFSAIEGLLSHLSPMQNGIWLGFFAGFVTASGNTPAITFGTQIIESLTQAGLSIGSIERFFCWMSCASMSPHNAGYANIEAVMKLQYKDALKIYSLFTFGPSFFSLIVVLILFKLGFPM